MEARARTSRSEWQKRIERWTDSGLTAEQFAAELGINVGTLRHWKYALGKRSAGDGSRTKGGKPMPTTAFVEIAGPAAAKRGGVFELELNGRRLHIPAEFDATALERLLGVLERR
jgi:hypothetical protein